MNNLISTNHAYKDIYEQYLDDASFLWLMRSIAVEQPHYDINDLKYLDQRIQSQLDGLMTSIDISWELCDQALELQGGGEVFTAAIIAFQSHDHEKIQKVVEAAFVSDDCVNGLCSALAWLPEEISHPWIKNFFKSKDNNHKYIAINVCHLRRENPGEFLNLFLNSDDCLDNERLYISLIRIAGELKRKDVLQYINRAISHDNPAIQFWAIWSSILLGNKQVVHQLEPFVLNKGPYQNKGIKLAFRVLPVELARQWVTKLSKDETQRRNVIIATGVMGDPQAIEWLILQMSNVELARVAAESFSLITGVNLEEALLTQDEPENIEFGPNENSDDDNIKLDDDENLPWPNIEMVTSYWNAIKSKYIIGHRYLLGSEIQSAILINKKDSVFQRQRHAVALELAILDMNRVHENTCAKVLSS